MNDEIAQQSQEPVEVAAPQPSTESTAQEAEVTMADVAKKYNVEEAVKSFTAQPAPQPAEPAPQWQPSPDPLIDLDGFNKYQIQQNQQILGAVSEMAKTVQEIQRDREQAVLQSEIKQAVGRVNERVNIDPIYTELLLEKEYRSDPVFRNIWDNRHRNHQALNEALDVISRKASKVFQVRFDPQLVENTRAAKASTKATATTKQDVDVMKMTDVEFDQYADRIKQGFI